MPYSGSGGYFGGYLGGYGSAPTSGPVTEAFEFEMQTTGADESFTIPGSDNGTYDAVIDWGDGSTSDITAFDDPDLTHTYSSPGNYIVRVLGLFPQVNFFSDSVSAAKVTKVLNLGHIGMLFASGMFRGCTNLTSFVSGNCDTSQCVNFDGFLMNTPNLTSADVSTIDTGSATSIAFMFRISGFNSTVSSLDTSSALSFQAMFMDNSEFNQDVSSFDMSAATDLSYMFTNCTQFDQDVSAWNIGNVNNLEFFLSGAGLSTYNYDALLVAWEGQSHQNNVTFNAGSSTYTAGSAAATARAALVADGWAITDLGGIGVDVSSIKDYVSTGSEGTFATCEFNDPINPVSSGVEYRARLIISGLTEGGFNLDFPSGGLTSTSNGTTEAFLTPGFAGTVRLRTAGSQPNSGATCSVVIQEYVAP